MTHCYAHTLNDLDDRQSEVLARLDQLDQRIEELLRSWTATEQALVNENISADQARNSAAA
jgi:hypothetical protein